MLLRQPLRSIARRSWPCAARALACAALGFLSVTGCSDRDAPPQARSQREPVAVTISSPRTEAVNRSIQAFGTLYGDEEATISAKVGGRIIAVYHDVGDRVRSGQPLAQIERRDYELARAQRELAVREALSNLGLSSLPQGELDPDTIPTVRKAKLAAENAQGRFARGKQLHDQQPPRLSDQEFADLQTAWEVAENEYQVQVLQVHSTLAEARARQAELELAEQQLADATVRAPIDESPALQARPSATAPAASTEPAAAREYSIAERMVSVGEFVREGTPLFRLIDDDPIKLRAFLPERYVGDVEVGQPVELWLDAYPERFMGRITRINPQIDPASRNFRVEAIFDNPRRLLKAGAFARASIQTRQEPNVIFVPQSAVVTFAGVNRVFVSEDGVAAERIVALGERRGEDIEIRSGLRGDELIVTSSSGQLTPGTPLQIQDTPVAATTAPAEPSPQARTGG